MEDFAIMKRSESLLYLAPIFLALSACSGGTKPALKQSPTPAQESGPKIGVIRESKIDGCGVALQLSEDYESKSGKYIFRGNLAEDAQMNIDGHDVDLKFVGSLKPNNELKVGDTFLETYAGEGLNVRIDYVVTKTCDPGDEGCEVTHYRATINVDHNGVRQQVETLGSGGC
jgi:hypothetical protein